MVGNSDSPQSVGRDLRAVTPPRFYVIASEKLFALSVFSFGLYLMYWSYKNWSLYKLRSKKDIWPLVRGFFYIFFVHQLYREAHQKIRSSGTSFNWDFEKWATILVVTTISMKVVDLIVSQVQEFSHWSGLILFMFPLQAYAAAQNQRLLNLAVDDPEGQSNSRLTRLNYLIVVPGAVLWIASLYGMFRFLR